MPFATWSLTGDVANLVDGDYDPNSLRVTLEASQPMVSDGATRVRVGDVAATITAGAFTFTGIPATVSGAPLYRVLITWTDGASRKPRHTATGWFAMTANSDLAVKVTETVTPTVIDATVAADIKAAAALGATNDTATASYVNNPASATSGALKATYVTKGAGGAGVVQGKPHAATEFIGGDATANGMLDIYSQIGTPTSGHDIALVVGGMADIAFRHAPGGTGKIMFEVHGKVPSQMASGWQIQQGDNSPVLTLPSVGGEVLSHGVIRGANGASNNLLLKIGGTTGSLIVSNSTGTTRLGVDSAGTTTAYHANGTTAGFQIIASGDTAPRAILQGDRLRFGDGITVDVNLYRAAAGVIRSDARLDLVGKDIIVQLGTAGVEAKIGNTAGRLFVGLNATSQGLYFCTGTPEGAITAPVGSLAVRSDGGAATTLYVKETGVAATGWVAK